MPEERSDRYKIGIVNVTTVGSAICQNRISELGGPEGDYPEYFVHAYPFKKYRESVIKQDWATMRDLIIGSLQHLNTAGADFIIIPSNTPHYAYDDFAQHSEAPILDLTEITAEACEKSKLKKVAILGTKATMTGGLYKQKIESRGMELVVPSEEICNAIHEFIMNEIVPGKVNPDTRKKVLELIQSVDCDGFILGCTELPEVYSSTDLGKTAIDTTRLIAEVAFDIAMRKDEENMNRYAHRTKEQLFLRARL